MKETPIVIDYPGDKRLFVFLKHQSEKVEDILEEVFEQFNAGSGRECQEFHNTHMRSLSVGDFVNIEGQWWECAACGWKKVEADHVYQMGRDVKNHPNFEQYGAWGCAEMIRRKLD